MNTKHKLITEQLELRSITKEDVVAIFSYRSLPDVARYQYWTPYIMDDAVRFVQAFSGSRLSERGIWIGLAVVSKDDGKLIGDCALKIGDTHAEIGCNISPCHQHRGYAREVLASLIQYCFHTAQVGEVFGITDTRNSASVCLMQSVGMLRDTKFEERIFCKDEWCVEHKYAIRKKGLSGTLSKNEKEHTI